MKNYGKVTQYNGVYGRIKGVDGVDYVLLDKNVVDNCLSEFDNVEFEPEEFKTPEVKMKMAMFVKRLTKDQERQRNK